MNKQKQSKKVAGSQTQRPVKKKAAAAEKNTKIRIKTARE